MHETVDCDTLIFSIFIVLYRPEFRAEQAFLAGSDAAESFGRSGEHEVRRDGA